MVTTTGQKQDQEELLGKNVGSEQVIMPLIHVHQEDLGLLLTLAAAKKASLADILVFSKTDVQLTYSCSTEKNRSLLEVFIST